MPVTVAKMKWFPAIYRRLNPPEWAANEYDMCATLWGMMIGVNGTRAPD